MAGRVPNFSSTRPRRSSVCGGSVGSAKGGCWAGGNRAEIFFGEGQAVLRRDVAEHQQHGVVRHVIRLEKFLNVGKICGVEIVKIAVKIVGICPIAEGDRGHIEPGKAAIRLIQNVDANFFFYDVALVAQIFLVDFQGTGAGFLLAERNALIVVADPHARGDLRRKADVPGIGEVVGRAGLAARRAPDLLRANAGAELHHVLQHGHHRARHVGRNHVGDVRRAASSSTAPS